MAMLTGFACNRPSLVSPAFLLPGPHLQHWFCSAKPALVCLTTALPSSSRPCREAMRWARPRPARWALHRPRWQWCWTKPRASAELRTLHYVAGERFFAIGEWVVVK